MTPAARIATHPELAESKILDLQAQLQQRWQPIETAPKSKADGSNVEGIYLLGFIPDPDMSDLYSCIGVIWWEPLMNKGKGMWYGESCHEVHPTHWMPLPAPPRCEYCDDTGYVSSLDGEWRGTCSCPAGKNPTAL